MQLDLVSDVSGQTPKQIQFGCESACLRACVHLKEVTVFSIANGASITSKTVKKCKAYL